MPAPAPPLPPACWIPPAVAPVSAPSLPSAPAPPLPPAVQQLVDAKQKALQFRDPKFPGAGLLREDGGIFGVLACARTEGRQWL